MPSMPQDAPEPLQRCETFLSSSSSSSSSLYRVQSTCLKKYLLRLVTVDGADRSAAFLLFSPQCGSEKVLVARSCSSRCTGLRLMAALTVCPMRYPPEIFCKVASIPRPVSVFFIFFLHEEVHDWPTWRRVVGRYWRIGTDRQVAIAKQGLGAKYLLIIAPEKTQLNHFDYEA